MSNTKIQIYLAILGGVFLLIAAVISSPHWFKYFFPDQYLEQEKLQYDLVEGIDTTVDNDDEKSNEFAGTENVVIDKLEVCPANSIIPSYFYLDIKNIGTKTIAGLNVTIDFGRSNYSEIDFPNLVNINSSIDTTKKNIVRIQLPFFNENDNLTIYCLLDAPLFQSIKINGENMNFAKIYSFGDYLKSEGNDNSGASGFFIYLQLLIGGILLALSIYFISAIYVLLKKKNLIN